jgi:hypothetical protein
MRLSTVIIGLLSAAGGTLLSGCGSDPVAAQTGKPPSLIAASLVARVTADPAVARDVHAAATAFMVAGSDEAVSLSALLRPGDDTLLGVVQPANAFRAAFERELAALPSAASEPIRQLIARDELELYWPFSLAWDGSRQPAAGAFPDGGSDLAVAFAPELGGALVPVDDDYSMQNPLILVRERDAALHREVGLRTFASAADYEAFKAFALGPDAEIGPEPSPGRLVAQNATPAPPYLQLRILGVRAVSAAYQSVLNRSQASSTYGLYLNRLGVAEVGTTAGITYTSEFATFVLPKSFFLNRKTAPTVPPFRYLGQVTTNPADLAGLLVGQPWIEGTPRVTAFVARRGVPGNVITLASGTKHKKTTKTTQGRSLNWSAAQEFTIKSTDMTETATGTLTQKATIEANSTVTWETSFSSTVTLLDNDFLLVSRDLDRDITWFQASDVWVANNAGSDPRPTRPKATWSGPYTAYKLDNALMNVWISLNTP